MITITFNTEQIKHDFGDNVADLLRELARRFERSSAPTAVMDHNGNSIGTVVYTEDGTSELKDLRELVKLAGNANDANAMHRACMKCRTHNGGVI